jgi:hypothetical protein
MMDNIMRNYYHQSILASEHSAFPVLPKAASLDSQFPGEARSSPKKRKYSTANIQETLHDALLPTTFQKVIDAELSTPALLISGREQPLGGAGGAPEQLRPPLFIPNSAYGGTSVPFR